MNWSLRLIKSSVQEILYYQSLKGILAILSEMTEESYLNRVSMGLYQAMALLELG